MGWGSLGRARRLVSWSMFGLGSGWLAMGPVGALQWCIFADHSGAVLILWIICVVYVSCLFIAALWSPEGRGLTSWLLFVMFVVILLLIHLVSWDMCGT